MNLRTLVSIGVATGYIVLSTAASAAYPTPVNSQITDVGTTPDGKALAPASTSSASTPAPAPAPKTVADKPANVPPKQTGVFIEENQAPEE